MRHVTPIRIAIAAILATTAGPVAGAGAAESARPATGELSARLGELAGKELRSASEAEQAEAVSLPARGAASLLRDGGSLVVEVRVTSRTVDRIDGLEAAGGEIMHISPEYRTVTVSVPEGSLRALGEAAGVEAVTEVLTPMVAGVGGGEAAAVNTCTGVATSEGDAQLKAAAARTQFDVDGAGVEVGVLSDSYDTKTTGINAADDIASGDLPGPGNPCGRATPVRVIDDSEPAGSDEGRAMMQLVHDLAPGSPLAFATAFAGETAFADNIRKLAAGGAKVIVDDVTYFDEPFFQDGPIAVAVNDVTAEGVAYYSSAANNNIISGGRDVSSFEASSFRAGSCAPFAGAQCMNFDPAGGPDPSYEINVPNGRTVSLDLQWAQPWNGVTTDLQAFLVNPANAVVAASPEVNLTTQKPFDFVSYTNTTGATESIRLFIQRSPAGDGLSPRLKFILLQNGGQSVFPTTYVASNGGDIVGPSIFGHNGAANAISTAAVPFNNSNTVESFSSRGPVTQYFGPVAGTAPAAALATPAVLQKPDLAATDGGLTTFFGGGNRFYGTSAAAPHAAAVAALQLEANPGQSITQVKNAQRATADPVGAFGPLAVGSGLVDALGAVAANPPPAPTVTVPSSATVANPTPTLVFSTTGDLSSLTCSVDAAAALPCFSPFTAPAALADGPHSLTVRATDYFGASSEGSGSFSIDTTGPATQFDRRPKNRSFKRGARFAFSAEPGASFRCSFDRKAFAPCAGSFKKRVRFGRHRFQVVAFDALGNAGPTVGDRWRVKKR